METAIDDHQRQWLCPATQGEPEAKNFSKSIGYGK